MQKEYTLSEIDEVATEISKRLKHKIVLLNGQMGAGKTTLVKAIAKALGVREVANSPTFSIVNEYPTIEGGVLYHFDMYRLESEEEAYDFGIEEYLDSGNFCFIEWSERISNLLPEEVHTIDIEIVNNTVRQIQLR